MDVCMAVKTMEQIDDGHRRRRRSSRKGRTCQQHPNDDDTNTHAQTLESLAANHRLPFGAISVPYWMCVVECSFTTNVTTRTSISCCHFCLALTNYRLMRERDADYDYYLPYHILTCSTRRYAWRQVKDEETRRANTDKMNVHSF